MAGGKEKGCANLNCVQMRALTVSFGLDKPEGVGEWGPQVTEGYGLTWGQGLILKWLSSSVGGLAAPPASGCLMLAALVMFINSFVVQAKAIYIASNTYSDLKAHFSLVEAKNRYGEKSNSRFFKFNDHEQKLNYF